MTTDTLSRHIAEWLVPGQPARGRWRYYRDGRAEWDDGGKPRAGTNGQTLDEVDRAVRVHGFWRTVRVDDE